MSTSGNLSQRLEKSGSVTSLRAELAVLQVLRRERWRCYHGAFYVDSIEHKLREMDVLARRVWNRKRSDREEVSPLNMLVEVKSARDWQLLFSQETPQRQTASYVGRIWAGFHEHPRYPCIPGCVRHWRASA
jgi:hypothetical protein